MWLQLVFFDFCDIRDCFFGALYWVNISTTSNSTIFDGVIVFWADNTWAKCACERMENGRDFDVCGCCSGICVGVYF